MRCWEELWPEGLVEVRKGAGAEVNGDGEGTGLESGRGCGYAMGLWWEWVWGEVGVWTVVGAALERSGRAEWGIVWERVGRAGWKDERFGKGAQLGDGTGIGRVLRRKVGWEEQGLGWGSCTEFGKGGEFGRSGGFEGSSRWSR